MPEFFFVFSRGIGSYNCELLFILNPAPMTGGDAEVFKQ